MEVSKHETAARTMDRSTLKFTWTISNFSRQNTRKLYSDMFVVGGYKWRILIFPKGNNVDHLSIYLDVSDAASLPPGWSRYARFSVAVVNQIPNKYTVRKESVHRFNLKERDWGFTSFMPLSELYEPSRGFLLDDTVLVEAEVIVGKVPDKRSYDSKKETGFVVIKYQVSKPETVASIVENKPAKDPSTLKFRWTIPNFSRQNVKKLYSDIFDLGGYKWRILIFPRNNFDMLSIYLDASDAASLPYGWSRYAQFSIAVVNQINSKYTLRKETQHKFNAKKNDWGFTSFILLSELCDPSRGYIQDDTVLIEGEVILSNQRVHVSSSQPP